MRSRLRFFLVFCFALLAVGAVRAQTNVSGQILLPNGQPPEEAIRFELNADDGSLHDLRFTDSHGRFVLERLGTQLSYTIVVTSDSATWGTTTYSFIPGYNNSVRFYLLPYVPPKGSKAASVSAASRYKPDQKAVDLHDRGMQALKEGRIDDALTLLQRAVDADPKYADGCNDLGVVQMRKKDYSAAESTFRKGLGADPKSPALDANLGEALNHQKKYSDAIAPLRESTRLMPDLPGAHVQLGVALVETDSLLEAKRELETAQSQEGDNAADDPVLQLYLGDLYARTGEFPKGVAALNLYLKLAPNAANASSVKSLIARMQQAIDSRHH